MKLCMKVMQKVDDLPMAKHHGKNTMMATLSKSLYWPNMKEDMEYYVHMFTSMWNVNAQENVWAIYTPSNFDNLFWGYFNGLHDMSPTR